MAPTTPYHVMIEGYLAQGLKPFALAQVLNHRHTWAWAPGAAHKVCFSPCGRYAFKAWAIAAGHAHFDRAVHDAMPHGNPYLPEIFSIWASPPHGLGVLMERLHPLPSHNLAAANRLVDAVVGGEASMASPAVTDVIRLVHSCTRRPHINPATDVLQRPDGQLVLVDID